MSVGQYFARLPNPVHVAAWVDDLRAPAPVSLVNDFMRGISPSPGLLVALEFSYASPAGWGWSVRPQPRADPVLLCGQWSSAPSLAGAAWIMMAQPCFTESGMPCDPVHRQAMAVLRGLHATSRQLSLHTLTLVISTHCVSTALALERGSCSNALQDISMLFQACLQLKLGRPALMTASDLAPPRTSDIPRATGPLGLHGLVHTGPEGPDPRPGRCRRSGHLTRPVRLLSELGLRSVLFSDSRGRRRSNGCIHASQLGRVAMSWLSAAPPGLRTSIPTLTPCPGGRQSGLP